MKRGAEDFMVCSCYKKGLFRKKIKEGISQSLHDAITSSWWFFGEGVGGFPWQQMRALLSKEGTLIFFLSHSLSCVCVCVYVRATHAYAHTSNFILELKKALLSAPQIWSDGKPLTPASQRRFWMVPEKGCSCELVFLHCRGRVQQRGLCKRLEAKS